MLNTKDYEGYLVFAFENGKVAKVPLNAYWTKTNRKKLINAYSDKSPLAGMAYCIVDGEFVITSSSGRKLLLHSGAINAKTSKSTQGVAVMKLKKGHRVMSIEQYVEGTFAKPSRYRTRTLPALGALYSEEDEAQQLSII
jgi:DNA gyrase subunit A